jgi:hypothetical protein
MHIVVPYFCLSDPAAREALTHNPPPALVAWLAEAEVVVADMAIDDPDESHPTDDYASGYEHFLAYQCDHVIGASATPHVALKRHWAGLASDGAWGELRLVHWQVRREDIVLHPQLDLQVTEAEHSAIEQSIAPLLAEDGFALHTQSPGVWHIQGNDLLELDTATPERAAGRDMRSFMPHSEVEPMAAQRWRRIANELQMLLYNHALNDARESRGQLSLNAVWLSGCGALPSPAPAKPDYMLFERHITPLMLGT